MIECGCDLARDLYGCVITMSPMQRYAVEECGKSEENEEMELNEV